MSAPPPPGAAVTGVATAFARAASQRPPSAAAACAARRPQPVERPLLIVGALVWTLVVLMIVPEGFDYRQLATQEAPASGGLLSRLLWMSLLGGGLAVIAWRARLGRQLVGTLNLFLPLFVLLAIASLAWSIDPPLTARRLVRVLTMVAVAGAFVIAGWHARRFQSVLRPLLTLMLIGSIGFGLAMPQWAIHPEIEGPLVGAWHGLANHKNGLGNLACIALLMWCHAALAHEVRLPWAVIGGCVALICLVLARSATSMVTATFTVLFLVLLLRSPRLLQRYMPWVVMLFAGALLVYSLALLQVIPGISKLLGPVGLITGKDMSFTGRTDIWDIMSAEIRLHPILGAGYGAYWAGPVPGTASYEFVRLLNFYPASAHNGYLEVLNDLGALGLLVLLGFLAVYILQCLRLLPHDRAQAALFLALLLQQAITNLSESRWLNVQSVDFVIMTLATAALARALLDQGLHRIAARPRGSRQSSPATAPQGRLAQGDGDAAR
ncbi:O-antigen ligase family protein [Sinimarinibacterium flocculans]|uniref:O-antigen ligase family protein n=1 Tax=Sinimarinibacterium flocculans TaxID=985250 RepID=UPI002491CCEA|nr:O-antigen ligase family protein [Sinimarinibacterium flocculans]